VSVDSRVGTTFGKYKISGILGRGGMGEVYEAYDTEIGRAVALKIIKSQFADDRGYRTRFERESHAVAKLQEPHVIPIHGFGEIDGCLFLDMRLVRGTDLQSLLEKEPLDPSRAVGIITQVAAALDAAHAEGLIHRDVKPQNVIVTPADFAYLVDFGIAEVIGETRLTVAGSHIGSWPYMAPERFGDQDLTPAVDVYALTCVLYESLTAQLPFPADSQEALVAAHLQTPPPRPSLVNPKVPPAFDDVIARGMAKEPDDRYGSAGALGRAATRALRGDVRASPPVAESASAPTQYAPPSQYVPPNQYAPPNQYPSWPPLQRQMPPADPQVYPPSGPQPVFSGGGPGRAPAQSSSRWLVPTVIVVSAALVLGAIGVVIGLLAKLNNPPNPTAAPVTPQEFPPSPTSQVQSSPPSVSAPPVPLTGTPPPLVTGPDNSVNHTTCDAGYHVANQSGFATHSGRGTPDTSCLFANNVLASYWDTYGNASTLPRTVSAAGAVACGTIVGATCDPKNPANFLMHCAQDGIDDWLRCVGGKDAVVYLW
jgi:serine/threonine protein kinase